MVRNGDNGYLYVDGVQDASASGLAARNASSLIPLYIGYEGNGTRFNGSIDDVRIYNRVLSATEISQLYNSAKKAYIR